MNAAFCFLDDPEENKFTGTTIQENNELNEKREKEKKMEFQEESIQNFRSARHFIIEMRTGYYVVNLLERQVQK